MPRKARTEKKIIIDGLNLKDLQYIKEHTCLYPHDKQSGQYVREEDRAVPIDTRKKLPHCYCIGSRTMKKIMKAGYVVRGKKMTYEYTGKDLPKIPQIALADLTPDFYPNWATMDYCEREVAASKILNGENLDKISRNDLISMMHHLNDNISTANLRTVKANDGEAQARNQAAMYREALESIEIKTSQGVDILLKAMHTAKTVRQTIPLEAIHGNQEAQKMS